MVKHNLVIYNDCDMSHSHCTTVECTCLPWLDGAHHHSTLFCFSSGWNECIITSLLSQSGQGTYLCLCTNNGNEWWTAIHACNADHHSTNTFSLHRSPTAVGDDMGHKTHLVARFILLLICHTWNAVCVCVCTHVHARLCEFIHCIWVCDVCHSSGSWRTPVTAVCLCSFRQRSVILVCCFSQQYPLSWLIAKQCVITCNHVLPTGFIYESWHHT